MTNEQIQELREREAAATEGLWVETSYRRETICGMYHPYGGENTENGWKDAEFVATIRNNASELLDRAERANELEGECEMLRSRGDDAISQALTERDYWRAKFENLARESAHSDELAAMLIEVGEDDIKRLRAELNRVQRMRNAKGLLQSYKRRLERAGDDEWLTAYYKQKIAEAEAELAQAKGEA